MDAGSGEIGARSSQTQLDTEKAPGYPPINKGRHGLAGGGAGPTVGRRARLRGSVSGWALDDDLVCEAGCRLKREVVVVLLLLIRKHTLSIKLKSCTVGAERTHVLSISCI